MLDALSEGIQTNIETVGPKTLDTERILRNKFPEFFQKYPDFLTSALCGYLRYLLHEDDINRFIADNADAGEFEFIERVLSYFNASFSVPNTDREHIPSCGRAVLIANHPLGSLDALSLVMMAAEVRKDIRIVAGDMLTHIQPIQGLILPVDNFSGHISRQQIRHIQQALDDEQLIIIFPAGEVSRARPDGIRDVVWHPGFLRFARLAQAPVIPVHINASNSRLFYLASMMNKPLSALLLVSEMFKNRNVHIKFRIGKPVPRHYVDEKGLTEKALVGLFRRHLYRIGKGKTGLFKTEVPIAHPEDRQQLKQDLSQCQLLGATRDDKQIYLFDGKVNTSLMREVGRLREISFRRVGEGSGRRRDIDEYDQHYCHIVLWDNEALEIVGAYRLGVGQKILSSRGVEGFYLHSLFRLNESFETVIEQGIELGRSFVQPRYWGTRGLDYLWQGIGAYLAGHPEIRYLYGPVSIPQSFPKPAVDMMISFYQRWYGERSQQNESSARNPYSIDTLASAEIVQGKSIEQDAEALKQLLAIYGVSVPTLYKQYLDLCDHAGTHFLGFNIDPDFSFCVDGLILIDLKYLKTKKRKRYIERYTIESEHAAAA